MRRRREDDGGDDDGGEDHGGKDDDSSLLTSGGEGRESLSFDLTRAVRGPRRGGCRMAWRCCSKA